MKDLPLISVIIPVFNVENYLDECVNSILNQTYSNFEIILVDDGSTDSSGDICDKFQNISENVYVFHQKNAGLSEARTAGYLKSSGKYIYFLDSDDYIAPDTLERLCKIAESDSADVVFFDAHSFMDKSDESVKQNYKRIHKYNSAKGIEVFEKMQELGEFHSAVPLLFLKKSFIDKYEISFIPGVFYEDMAYTFSVFCLAETVSQCSEALYFRRYRADSIMTSKKSPKYFNSMISVYRFILEFSCKYEITDNIAVKKYLSRIANNVINNFEKLDKADKLNEREKLTEIKKDILQNNAFDDTALKLRCHNKFLWFSYKVFCKLIGR